MKFGDYYSHLAIAMIPQPPRIFTSYYGGRQIGESISISLSPPKSCKFTHLRLFAPSKKLLDFWNSSNKDKDAEDKYTDIFREELNTNRNLIDLWIQKNSDKIVTFNCYEPYGQFCHRHLLEEYLSSAKWEGEVEASNKISVCDATWEDIFGSYYEIIFDGRTKEQVLVTTTPKKPRPTNKKQGSNSSQQAIAL